MANVISKLLMSEYSMPYNCYELGHTWTPFCSRACLDVGYFVFFESFKMYAGLYLTTHFVSRHRFEWKHFMESMKSVFRSSTFLGFNAFAAIAAFCCTRKVCGKFYLPIFTHIPAIVANFMAIYLERRSRRSSLAFYVTNIASESVYKLCVSKGVMRRFRNDELLLFTLTMTTLMYLIKRNGYGNDFVSLVLRLVIGNEENCKRCVDTFSGANRSTETKCENIISERKCGTFNEVIESYFTQSSIGKYIRGTRLWFAFKSWFNYKHKTCPHRNTCVHYAVNGFFRCFIPGWLLSALFVAFKRPQRLLKQPSILYEKLTDRGCINFGLFLATFSCAFKSVNCILRTVNDADNAWHASVAAFVASFATLFSPNSTITQYLFWKCIETLYFLAAKNNYVKHTEITLNFLYAVSCAQLFYVSVVCPTFMRASYMKFLLRMTNNYLAKLNRNIIDTLGVQSSAGFELFEPNLEYEHTSKKFREAVLMWSII